MSAPEPKHEASSQAKVEEEGVRGYGRFAAYMKGGACRDAYVDWKQCIDAAAANQVADGDASAVNSECQETTLAMSKCLIAHKDYYDPKVMSEVLNKGYEDVMAESEKEGLEINMKELKKGPSQSSK